MTQFMMWATHYRAGSVTSMERRHWSCPVPLDHGVFIVTIQDSHTVVQQNSVSIKGEYCAHLQPRGGILERVHGDDADANI